MKVRSFAFAYRGSRTHLLAKEDAAERAFGSDPPRRNRQGCQPSLGKVMPGNNTRVRAVSAVLPGGVLYPLDTWSATHSKTSRGSRKARGPTRETACRKKAAAWG